MSDAPRRSVCGVLLPDASAAERLEAARVAQRLGFASVWAAHGSAPGLDGPASLAGAAAVTDTIALGVDLTPLHRRAAAWIAKQLSTVDRLAGAGRLRVGLGLTAPGTVAATDEVLGALPDLLTGPTLAPPAASMPPIYVCGDDEATLRRAARAGDTWLATGLSAAQVAERSTQLAEMALEHDRPAPAVALLAAVRVDDDRRAAEPDLRGAGDGALLDSIDGLVERLGEYQAIGVSEFLLRVLGPDTPHQYERLAAVSDRLVPRCAAPTR